MHSTATKPDLFAAASQPHRTTGGINRMNIGKPFRLIDFKTFDATPSSLRSAAVSNGGGEDSDGDSDNAGSGSEESSAKRAFEPRQFLIQMFGVNEQGQTCSVIVEDFRPFFYMRVGDEWNEGMVQVFVQELVHMTGQPWLHKQIVQAKLVQYHKLYGFSGGKKDRFIHVVCLNSTVFSRLKNLWYKKDPRTGQRRLRALPFHGTSVELYESNIPPLLRFFHLQNVSPSGWVSILHNRAFKPTVKTTSCTFEYVCSQKHVVPLPEKETRVPYKIMSFDIEASSSHGDFPLPQKTYKKLAQNIVDLFLENFSDPQTADRASVGDLVRRCMVTAFGFGSFEGVDLVYPKRPPPLERVHRAVDTLLSMPLVRVDSMVHADGEEDKTQLLTLSAMFDKMREHMDAGVGGGGGGNDEDEDADDLAAAAASAIDDEPDEADAAAPVYVSGVQVDQSCTLVDLLLSAQYSRDSKITRIDETLTRQLPTLKGDEVTFIGSTFVRYGDAEPHLNHCFAVGDCDAVPGCVVETAPTEREMLVRWAQLVRREDPDIVIGYNIFGFDYEFMFRRAIETRCVDEFLQLSRRLGEVCLKDDPFASQDGGARPPQIDRTTIALASGDYDLNFVKMSGRLQIDMYMFLRREYQFGSYRLDDMASYFISDDIKRVEVVHGDGAHGADDAPHTWLYSQNLMGLHVGDFIHIEITSFTSDYYADGKKFEVVDIRREADGSNVIVVAGDHGSLGGLKNIKWGMAKDDVTPQDIFAMTKGSPADRARVAKYCVQDCNLVHHLLNKVDVLTGYIEMSSICSVPISFLVFRGQGIKLQSYVAKKCREKQTLMPDLDKTGGNEGYEGAIVLPPKCSMYMDNPVACVDYESLYPSGMISENFSHDSKVWTKEYDLSGNLIRETGEKDPRTGAYKYDRLPGYRYIDREFDTYRYVRKTPTSAAVKTKSGKMICRWAQFPDDKKGIMPSILQELLKARADTRKKAKVEPDPFMQNVLDKRQLGYKVTANSLYGQCGAKTSSFYEKDVAASTTATGRMMITYARRIIEEVYGHRIYHTEGHGSVLTKAEYVYGDTDSVFFTFNLADPSTGEPIRGKRALEITIEIAQDAAHLCSRFLKPPMRLAYEKTLMPFVLLKKKRYFGMLYETDPNKGKLKYMGLSLKRRDSCDYLKDTYGGILHILMKEHDLMKSIEFLNVSLERLVLGQVPMDKLTITRALSSYYKNPQQIAHAVLAERIAKRDPGNKPKPGDRMKYVFFENPHAKLQGDKIELPEYVLAHGLKVDYAHYIERQLMKPLQQLYGLALDQIWAKQNKMLAIRSHAKEVAELRKKYPDQETFAKKHDEFCSKKVKPLLFDKWLTQVANKRNHVQDIAQFFVKKPKL
jgi:DNA polymerase elongation subunit (family B)